MVFTPARRLPALRLAIALVVTVVVAGLVAAQPNEEIDPTGGLRNKGMVPNTKPSGSSRDELIRQWDLDGNGTIDASEAAVARARMRRARLQMELDGGIDPVTGKPRVSSDEPPPTEGETVEGDADDPPEEAAKRPASGPALPGTRVPDVKPVISGSDAARGDTAGQEPTTSSGTTPRSSRPAPPVSRPGSIIGGVRAGAPAARPGYGSIAPKPDFNAGAPRPPAGRGGLVPSARPQPVPRTPAAPPPSPKPAPVTADEIGDY